MTFTQEQAELRAIEVLGWMANDPEIMSQFMGWSGADVDALRQVGSSPELMLALIDFVLLRDDWVVAAAQHIGIAPEQFVALRTAFPGGQESHWT